MIGIGTWEASVNTMFFSGTGRAAIIYTDGKYDFKFEVIGESVPEIIIDDVEENGNTLTATAQCELFKGKKIPITAVFDGDTVTGTAKLPFVGNIKVRGHKIK